MKKRIFSISMIKNEADIIETFIRYHIDFLDGMVILDNGSTDRTAEIILKLAEEDLPVYLVFDDNPSYEQADITTELLYTTIKSHNPDYVIPLDVDEFLTTDSDKSVRQEIEDTLNDNTLYYLSWITYVPTEKDDISELNILKRITHRRKFQFNHDQKIIFHTSIPKKYDVLITQGNHDLLIRQGIRINKSNLLNFHLAHYPLRSIGQVKSKFLVGWLANLARKEQVLFDWYYFYNIIKNNDIDMKYLKQMASCYNVLDRNLEIKIIDNPLYLHNQIELKYTRTTDTEYFNNVLNYCESLAKKYSKLLYHRTNEKEKSYHDQMILQIIKPYILINGWLSTAEAIELYKIASSFTYKNDVVICEIGSWQGKSSYILAKAIESKKDAWLYCIDPFDGKADCISQPLYQEEKNKIYLPLLQKFKNNINKLGVAHKIKIIQGDSSEVVHNFNKNIDLLFIDGNHDYDAVLNDYLEWSKLVKIGGYILFHDVGASHLTGPKQVVEQQIVKNPIWSSQALIDELYIAKRVK